MIVSGDKGKVKVTFVNSDERVYILDTYNKIGVVFYVNNLFDKYEAVFYPWHHIQMIRPCKE
jgi:hypothetical protein